MAAVAAEPQLIADHSPALLAHSMPLVEYLLAPLAIVGHIALWSRAFNRTHASDLPCRILRPLGKLTLLILLFAPAAYVARLACGAFPPWRPVATLSLGAFGLAYLASCWAIGLAAVLWRLARSFHGGAEAVLSNDTTTVDVVERLGRRPVGDWAFRILSAAPGNQVLQLRIQSKVIAPHRLSRAHDGLIIAHLSDLHFTGRLTKAFFHCVVDLTNEMDADLVAITGDFVENVRYLDWVREVLSRVQSRYGVYYVLGNHDKRLRDAAPLRRALSDAGLIDLGGRWVKVEVRGEPLILAGNELPWFRPPAPMEDCPGVAGGARPLRVLLAHTPDQLPWARSFDFDLMLAGHTHGGQIRFPIIGPLVVPSRYGAKYAAGAFYEDPTLLHVTRGVSSLEPLRFRCPPELARLVLQIDPSVVHVPFAEEHGQTC